MTEVVVIGAGAVGLACALALARRGFAARVLDRGAPGAEASSAAAGIVGAQIEARADGPMVRLAVAGRSALVRWAEELGTETGIDVELRRTGVLHLAASPEEAEGLAAGAAWQRDAGLRVETLDGAAARALEPALSDQVAGGVRFPDDARVDAPKLVLALRVAAERAGVVLHLGAGARRVLVRDETARGVVLDDGTTMEAAHVVVAAGSWSSLVEGTGLRDDAVRPARGQIVELHARAGLVRSVIFGPGCYLSPRDDGRVLVGSTLELVGFRRGVTAGAVRDLLAAATRLVPALTDAELTRAHSGFRPHTRDDLPAIGPTAVSGLWVATGHHRSGILLAPVTGEIVAGLVAGVPPSVDIHAFSPARERVSLDRRK